MEQILAFSWLIIGIIIAIYGFLSFKLNKYNLIFWFGKKRVKHKNKFTEFFGKNITFLGGGTAVSSFFYLMDNNDFYVDLLLNALIVLYFVLEAFHLVKLYSKEIDETQTHTVK